MTVWITGKNMPGYLPETDPWPSESESAARADLVQDLEYDRDSHEQGDCPDDCEVCGEYLQAHTELHNGAQAVYADGLVYWVVQAEPLTVELGGEPTMYTYTTPLSRITSGDRARITLEFRQGNQSGRQVTTDHKPAGQYLEVSFVGETIGKYCDPAKDGSVRSCGQIIDEIVDDLPAAAHAWRRWHLNGLRTHCAHQDRAIPWDKCPPCPETGYRCGSAWLAEPLTVAGAVECMLAVGAEGYVIGRDGRAVEVTAADPLGRLLSLQGQSAHHATTFEGWTVTRVDGLTAELTRY